MEYILRKDRADSAKSMADDGITTMLWNSIAAYSPSQIIPWFYGEKEIPPPSDESVHEDDSIYGKSVATFGPSNIDDDFIFGKTGTVALRFRVATKADISFLKAVDIFNKGYRYAKKKNNKQALLGVKNILDGKMLAQLVSEQSTSYAETLNCELINEMIDYRIQGQIVDGVGVHRLRVKPGPDPNRPAIETKFLSEPEMIEKCNEPSQNWIEAGSGSLGQVKIEILSCEGLPNKDIGQFFGNKTDPFACLVFEDCLVETDVITDCLNPMWMPWTQRYVF